MPPIHQLRTATDGDAPAIAALVNAAYVVEAFFKHGERTTAAEIQAMLRSGRFLLLEADGRPIGCVYVQTSGSRGYFGMLSIDPAAQKQGLGARLLKAAEAECRTAGCTIMEIHVVNLRKELLDYYPRFGYVVVGTQEFPADEPTTMPCHFIVMRKPL